MLHTYIQYIVICIVCILVSQLEFSPVLSGLKHEMTLKIDSYLRMMVAWYLTSAHHIKEP